MKYFHPYDIIKQTRGEIFVNNNFFNYQLSADAIFFEDTIKKGSPYIAETPRNHESLFLVTNGTIMYENSKVRQVVHKGQVGYIARGGTDMSSAYNCDSVSYIATNFSFAKGQNDTRRTLPFDTLCSGGDFFSYEKLFKDALNSFMIKSPGYRLVTDGILMQIIGHLYNEYIMAGENLKKIKKIEKATEYLKNNYDNPEFKISTLANTVNMSEKHFRRLFFDVYNKTPYAYLQDFRINKAEILLLNTSKSVSDIASQCGFSDVYSFSHCFKRHMGISPTEYKNEYIR